MIPLFHARYLAIMDGGAFALMITIYLHYGYDSYLGAAIFALLLFVINIVDMIKS